MKTQKKVLIILGSPRPKGNSTILAQKCAEGATTAGAVVEMISLAKLKIAPCTACDACLSKPETEISRCIIKDDMVDLYPKVKAADAIVFASPTYWFNMSAQMKLFIDRCYAIQGNGRYAFTGKNIGIIMTYADVDENASGCINAIKSFQDICAFVKANIVGIVHGSAEKAGDIKQNIALLDAAKELGKKLAQPE